MSLYVDSSAFLKRYIEEPESAVCEELLLADPDWVSGRHSLIEVRRNLPRLLEGRSLATARSAFEVDWRRTSVVELDAETCERATQLAETLGVRTLDALHLGAAERVGGSALVFLTYDRRQAQAARSLGWPVVGA